MKRSISIMRRLVITVLILELVSAIALIGTITVHEWHTRMGAFDAMVMGTTQSLMGAVQDAEDEADDVMLDLGGVQLGRNAIYRVVDEQGRILGAEGDLPPAASALPAHGFRNLSANGKTYRFINFRGVRVIDPGKPGGGVRHTIDIVYGVPVGHVWHEVLESVRFFALSTIVLLGITTLAMVWLVKKGLLPLSDLAREAERINSSQWQFEAPSDANNTIELRPLATALEAAVARLQRSFEQQRRFTSDAAHELKTDLAIVKSSLQLLSMRRRTPEEYSQGLTLSLDDFTRLEMTVQKMLTLARLEQPMDKSGSDGLIRSCSLCDVVEEAIEQSKPMADILAIAISMDSRADVRVPIDRHDALLLCSNILLNAIQHNREGGSVRIALFVGEQGIQLTVLDEGEGILQEDLPHLFEPFYRGDPSRSRKSGGTGLGLSICKAICNRAGGSIEIVNHVTGGALVTVVLPVTSVSEPALSATIKEV
jgi:signal transduction histidine kinase